MNVSQLRMAETSTKPVRAFKMDNKKEAFSLSAFFLGGIKQFCFQAVNLILFTVKREAGKQMSALSSCSFAYQAG